MFIGTENYFYYISILENYYRNYVKWLLFENMPTLNWIIWDLILFDCFVGRNWINFWNLVKLQSHLSLMRDAILKNENKVSLKMLSSTPSSRI